MTNEILKFDNILQEEKVKKPKKVKREKRQSDEGCYVTNSEILPEIIKCKELGKVSPALAEMYQKIAKRYSLSKTFAPLPFREDLVSAAVLTLMQNGLKFNPEKSNNPFSYLTQICYHAFLNVISEEKKQRDIRDTLLLDIGMNASLGFMEKEHDSYRENHSDMFDNGM